MKNLTLLVVLLWMAFPALAGTCNYGLPCGPIPWTLPQLPALSSPTPMPTYSASVTPSPTATPTNFTPSPTTAPSSTPTPTYTPSSTATVTPLFDTGQLSDQMATVEALINSTPISVDVSGTPVTVLDQVATAAPGINDIFGRVKGILGAEWGGFTPLFQGFIVVVAVVFFVVALTYAIPMIGFVVGMVRKIYTAITDLLPL